MKARFFILSVLAAGLALVLVWTVAAQGTETKPQLLFNSQPVSALEDYQNQEKAACCWFTRDVCGWEAIQTITVTVSLFPNTCKR